ncbi:MAG TPA: TonB-dependent receptor plug domain-containing protein, partial [Brevundimonas sp.]
MTSNTMTRALLAGASAAALLASLALTPTKAWAEPAVAAPQDAPGMGPAQDPEAASVDDVIVTGVRQALATSLEIKKNADTFVDSITATDIGAFPDKSAAEALARVPGITVNRLQSADDSTHPSGEPTGVLIRGLTQVRTEFNGRDSFSADSARGLQFNDVSPELLAGVDSYKNQTAAMIEGGLAGTVNLRTRVPFDQNGLLLTGNLKANYGDRSGEWTPEYSALISNTWDTSVGRFGALASFARSDVITRTESVIMDKINTYCSAGFGTADLAALDADGQVTCSANPFGGTGFAYAPDGIRFSQVDYDRQRRGLAGALQYENNAGTFAATVQYLESTYRNAWLERASHVKLDGNYYGTRAFNPRSGSSLIGSSGLTFGSDGMLQSGLLTQPHGSFSGTYESLQAAINAGSAVPGLPFVNYCGNGVCGANPRNGLYIENEARNFDHDEGTRDLSANFRWDPTDRLRLTA